MAKALIAHLTAFYIPGPAGVHGKITPTAASLFNIDRMYADLDARCRGQPYAVEIDIRPVRDRRTLHQNRLMWALLQKMAEALGGDVPGSVTAEQCYLDMLIDFGADVEMWRVPEKAVDALRRAFRVVQIVEHLDNEYCVVRIGPGSSQFDPAEMGAFIDRIFDRLAELGVQDADTTRQYMDWRGIQ